MIGIGYETLGPDHFKRHNFDVESEAERTLCDQAAVSDLITAFRITEDLRFPPSRTVEGCQDCDTAAMKA